MRFDCGETWDAEKARLSDWHPFFVRWPITVEQRDGREICAWLETIERKGTLRYLPMEDAWWEWEYRWPENKST